MSEKVAYWVITYKDETLFQLGEDGYYIIYYVIYYIIILLYYIFKNYKPIITGNSISSNYIEYKSNNALFVKDM